MYKKITLINDMTFNVSNKNKNREINKLNESNKKQHINKNKIQIKACLLLLTVLITKHLRNYQNVYTLIDGIVVLVVMADGCMPFAFNKEKMYLLV